MIVLLVGLTASHIASTAFLSNDRHDAVVISSRKLCADRIATMAKLFDQRDVTRRMALAAEMDSPSLHISLTPNSAIESNHHDEDDRILVAQAFQPYFGATGHPRLHVVHKMMAHRELPLWTDVLHGFPRSQIMQVSFQLTDGSWANFELAMPEAASLWSPHAIGSILIMMLGIVILGAWATRWVGRPASTFAQAADRLGRDVNAPPLPEDGPVEMRRAVAAFNEMQSRIRRFVDDRTRLLAAISHDLRSPLTRLRLRTELLPDEEGRSRMLNDIDEMEAMVSSALDFARGEANDEATQAIDLAASLETICDNAADVGLPAEYARDGRLVCTCRPMALKRALTNLIENAARYGRRATVRAARKADGIEVTIEDEGPGIPASEWENVFTPFYRIDESRNRKTGGVGLGMTVARTIIRAHGGDIRLENRSPHGLRVTVTLPQ
ncbi:osmolarity sensor protein EnvZ [mine drainage metagenome]|uniref:histidine kinase n=1 Tax=mine drainage metagenome TaxID=410659 RepID=A0A1J5S914_9ZZZZ